MTQGMRIPWFLAILAGGPTACSADDPGAKGGSGGSMVAAPGGAGTGLEPGSGGSATGHGGRIPSSGGAPASSGGGIAMGGAGARSSGGASAGGAPESGGAGGSGGVPSAGGLSSGGASSGGAFPFGGAGGTQTGLPNGVSYLFPPPNGSAVCADAPLRVRFTAGAPVFGNAGKVSVHDASGVVVASLDMSAATTSVTAGGTTLTIPRRAFVDGNEAVFYVKGALAYGKTYYVTVDAGVVTAGGVGFVVTDASAWRFSTKGAAPGDAASYGVALDGTGDYCTVQGVLDVIPSGNTMTRTIILGPGTYHEIVRSRGKNDITLRGVDRKKTIIAGTNNENLNPGTATRSLVAFGSMSGLVVENLTIHNLTPQGGLQAEALALQACDKCTIRNADILSLQDTLLWSGRVYAKNCYIEGNVDYVWGTGVAFFDACELRTVGRSGVIVQSRNAAGAYGYVFVGSKLTADAAASNNLLARIDASMYPGSHVAYVDCEMQNVAPAGWSITGAATSSLRFWEYGSHDASGKPVNVSQRLGPSTQISAAQAATMRDVSAVLGGWTPAL